MAASVRRYTTFKEAGRRSWILREPGISTRNGPISISGSALRNELQSRDEYWKQRPRICCAGGHVGSDLSCGPNICRLCCSSLVQTRLCQSESLVYLQLSQPPAENPDATQSGLANHLSTRPWHHRRPCINASHTRRDRLRRALRRRQEEREKELSSVSWHGQHWRKKKEEQGITSHGKYHDKNQDSASEVNPTVE